MPAKSNNHSNKTNKQVVKLVHQIMNSQAETKQFVVSAAGSAVFAGSGSILVPILAGLVVGDQVNERTGDRVELQALDLKCTFYNGVGATANIHTVHRAILFQFIGDDTKAAPQSGFMLAGSALNAGGTYGAMSDFVHEYRRQYLVLHDHTSITTGTAGVAAAGSAGGEGVFHQHRSRVNLSKAQKNIQFTAAATTGVNMLYLLLTTDSGTVATNPVAGYDVNVLYKNI